MRDGVTHTDPLPQADGDGGRPLSHPTRYAAVRFGNRYRVHAIRGETSVAVSESMERDAAIAIADRLTEKARELYEAMEHRGSLR